MSDKYYFAPLPKNCVDHRFLVEDNVMLKKLVRSYVMKMNLIILKNDKISILNKMQIINKINKNGKIKELNLFNGITKDITEYNFY